MILTKPISPKKLNDKAMRAVIVDEAKKISDDIEIDFELTVSTWKKQPDFSKLISIGPKSIDILVGTDDEIYGYVNDGTRPHKIRPKRAKVLRFQSVYAAKTTPGKIGAHSGGASGPFVFSGEVNHPGTKARNFDETIRKFWEPRFKDRMEKAYAKSAKISGNEI